MRTEQPIHDELCEICRAQPGTQPIQSGTSPLAWLCESCCKTYLSFVKHIHQAIKRRPLRPIAEDAYEGVVALSAMGARAQRLATAVPMTFKEALLNTAMRTVADWKHKTVMDSKPLPRKQETDPPVHLVAAWLDTADMQCVAAIVDGVIGLRNTPNGQRHMTRIAALQDPPPLPQKYRFPAAMGAAYKHIYGEDWPGLRTEQGDPDEPQERSQG